MPLLGGGLGRLLGLITDPSSAGTGEEQQAENTVQTLFHQQTQNERRGKTFNTSDGL